MTATAWAENASFNSIRSTSSTLQPTFRSSFVTASTGVISSHLGGSPLTAWPAMRAIGVMPSAAALSAPITTAAAAPSFTPGAFPAVTDPPFLNAGFRRASAAADVSGRTGSSYSRRIGSPLRRGISTGRISSLK